MPSVQQELGKYVSVRYRKDGTARVLFEVPARLRPSDWPSTLPLPTNGRTGNLADPAEVARIQADAARLYERLNRARGLGQPVTVNERTFTVLIQTLQNSQAWKDNKPRTNKGYNDVLKDIRAWEQASNPDPTDLTEVDIEAFLSIFDDRPTTRYHVRKVLRMVMQQAVKLKWRVDNPVDAVKVSMPKSRVTIWEQDDVDIYVWAALSAGNPDLAAIILTEWEIGQRLTDIVLFRRGAEYLPEQGLFSFAQSKTDEPVTIPVSPQLQAILALIERPGSFYLFHDGSAARSTASKVMDLLIEGQQAGRIPTAIEMGKTLGLSDVAVSKAMKKLRLNGCITKTDQGLILTRAGWDDGARPIADVDRLSHVFADIRDRFVIPAGGRNLMLRALRHSCVVQLARHGAEVPEIVAVTGHSLASANQILKTYMPRDSKVAMNAQIKRGLVARA